MTSASKITIARVVMIPFYMAAMYMTRCEEEWFGCLDVEV